MSAKADRYSRSFSWRRVHSLLGLLLVLFLTEHLITNSQAALFFGETGQGFVHMVNVIHNLPYLPVIELTLIGLPLLFHGVLGVAYLFQARLNALPSNGSTPSLSYGRNHAFSWQRITSVILLVGIIAHVGYLRFYKYPVSVADGLRTSYFTRITMDDGLYTLSKRLNVKLFDTHAIEAKKQHLEAMLKKHGDDFQRAEKILGGVQGKPAAYEPNMAELLTHYQKYQADKAFVGGLTARSLYPGQVIAESGNFGAITILNVRDSFKSVWVSLAYTIFVLSAVFHAYNGLWTFLITWGAVIRIPSQKGAVKVCVSIMALIGALGLAAIWGTFWINLRY